MIDKNFFLRILMVLFTLWQLPCEIYSHNFIHDYSISVSQELSESIKQKLLLNIDRLANITAARQLKYDLNNGVRQMTILDSVTANQIFGIFGLSDPGCDKNSDGYLMGLQLKCLNKLWKYYVPENKNQTS